MEKETKKKIIISIIVFMMLGLITYGMNVVMKHMEIYEDPTTKVTYEEYGLVTDIISYETSSGFLSSSTNCMLEINHNIKMNIKSYECNKVISNHSILLKRTSNISSQLLGDTIMNRWIINNSDI